MLHNFTKCCNEQHHWESCRNKDRQHGHLPMTGNTLTCHCATASCREAPLGAWEMGIYLTAGAKVNHKMLQMVVRWDPRHDNNGNTISGLVARSTASLGEFVGTSKGSSVVLLAICWQQKSCIRRALSAWCWWLGWEEISLWIPACIFLNIMLR